MLLVFVAIKVRRLVLCSVAHRFLFTSRRPGSRISQVIFLGFHATFLALTWSSVFSHRAFSLVILILDLVLVPRGFRGVHGTGGGRRMAEASIFRGGPGSCHMEEGSEDTGHDCGRGPWRGGGVLKQLKRASA